MRDTEFLRRRLWAQIGLPLAAATLMSACGGATEPAPVQKIEEAEAEPREKGDGAKSPLAPASTYHPPTRMEDILEGEFDYFGPARDPFTDHDEEDGCPNGDWCGSPEDARMFSVDHIPEQLGCPAKIIAKPPVTNSVDRKEKRWKGLSLHPMMQGRLMTSVTEETREAEKDPTTCCYHWFEYCSGRPLLDGDRLVVAELRSGSNWSRDAQQIGAPDENPDTQIEASVRARLGELWANDGLMEHAAIGAFERATLELMAMAAPPELLGEIQVAAADEVDHAMDCFGLAARFSGVQREPGPLPALEPRVVGLSTSSDPGADWARLAVDTFVEGCVGETIATLAARRGMRHCSDPATLAILERVVDDEGRHAGLAWRTIRWILATAIDHRPVILEALRNQATAMSEAAESDCESLPETDADAQVLARYGRIDRRMELLARRDAWSELINPTLDALVDTVDELEPGAWL